MESDTWLVSPKELRVSGSVPADESVVKEYERLPADTIPPVQVVRHPEDGFLYVVDGHHTLESALKRKDELIPVQRFTENRELNDQEAEKRRLRWIKSQKGD